MGNGNAGIGMGWDGNLEPTPDHLYLVVQRFGVGLVIGRSLIRLPARELSSQLGQLSLPSLRGR